MISETRLQQALTYLAETDEVSAELKGNVSRQEYLAKRIRAKLYLVSDGSVEARKAKAETSSEVDEAEVNLEFAIVEFEKIRAKRATEELIVEVWRSMNANRRQGQI